MFQRFWKISRCVNNSRTNYVFLFFCDVGGFWVLNVPHPPPSPASMSKSPYGGKNIDKHLFTKFYHKKRNVVLKCLRRVAFVGWDVAELSHHNTFCVHISETNYYHRLKLEMCTPTDLRLAILSFSLL